MAVRPLGKIDEDNFADDAFTRQQVMDKLTQWREHLVKPSMGTLTRPEILLNIDKWLDELNELKGR